MKREIPNALCRAAAMKFNAFIDGTIALFIEAAQQGEDNNVAVYKKKSHPRALLYTIIISRIRWWVVGSERLRAEGFFLFDFFLLLFGRCCVHLRGNAGDKVVWPERGLRNPAGCFIARKSGLARHHVTSDENHGVS